MDSSKWRQSYATSLAGARRGETGPVSALGNPETDTVPFNKGRAVYLGLKLGL